MNRVHQLNVNTDVFIIDLSQTLYTIRARIEPSKGSEFIRAGTMCHFHTILHQVASFHGKEESANASDADADSIMYEVLADQNMWAVCGRTAGIYLRYN